MPNSAIRYSVGLSLLVFAVASCKGGDPTGDCEGDACLLSGDDGRGDGAANAMGDAGAAADAHTQNAPGNDGNDAPHDAAGGPGDSDGGIVCIPEAVIVATLVTDKVAFLPDVVVTTHTGGATFGLTDGPKAVSTFRNPVSVTLEPSGSLLVCDFDNDRIRRVDETGATTTLTTQLGFSRPFGFAWGTDGTLYVDTDFNPRGVKDLTTGTIWSIDRTTGVATVVLADLGRPRGLVGLPDGRLILADYRNERIRILDPVAKTVHDLAGRYACGGTRDGIGDGARFSKPYGIVVLPTGRVVVADHNNHRLRTVDVTTGAVDTFVGVAHEEGTVDGPLASARLRTPLALAVDDAGNIFLTDLVANRIRRIGTDGTVATVAGSGTVGFADGSGAEAQFHGLEGLTVTRDGKTLYVADGTLGEERPYNRIRKITIGR